MYIVDCIILSLDLSPFASTRKRGVKGTSANESRGLHANESRGLQQTSQGDFMRMSQGDFSERVKGTSCSEFKEAPFSDNTHSKPQKLTYGVHESLSVITGLSLITEKENGMEQSLYTMISNSCS